MLVKQVAELVNASAKEFLGETAVLNEDLSNVVDYGAELFNNTDVDNYVKSLVDQIGKIIFVNRPYTGNTPSILMDSWEFGSVLEKISGDLYDADVNESWELEDGKVYEQQTFYKPVATAKFFNSKVTFEIACSITERQVKESFKSADQLNAFVSMIYNDVDKSMTVRIDKLIKSTIASMIGETIKNGKATQHINLLAKYNAQFGTTLTAAKALTDADFIRYAVLQMRLTINRLSSLSRLYNEGGKARFTSTEYLKSIMLNEFKEAAGVYLYDAAGQYNTENIRLQKAETVPFWQGSGTDYGFDSTSKIDIKLKDGTEFSQSGILAVAFDRDALAVCNTDRRVTTAYNAKAEFYNNYFKFDCSYFADTNENFVVFYIAD